MSEAKASLVSSDGRVLRTESGSEFSAAIAKLNIEPEPSTWVWLNFSDSQPEPDALKVLLESASQSSELTGVIGPKLLATANPRTITQLGLTLTPLGEVFSPVAGVFDQGQHDRAGDVLAVGTAGMLIRSSLLAKIGNFDENAPVLAKDIDFSLRARMAGFRIMVEPKARVAWDGPATELGKRFKRELRKATIHLRLVYSPIWFALLYWLALPLLGVVRSVYRIAQKRPALIGSELYAAAWGFFTLRSRLRSRANVPANPEATFRDMKSLRASWNQVRLQAKAAADADEAEQNLAAFSRGFVETENAKSFTESLGWLFAGLLLVISWRLFPTDIAVTGGGAIPLSPTLGELFARAGASWQPIADGYFAPSDPFNWVLLLLGATTFWAPQFSIGLLLFLARPLAFAGAWRAIGLFSAKAWVKTIGALAYALWPALQIALAGARIADVVAGVTLPWLVLAVARAAGVGRVGSSRSNRQTWSWVALAGLLLAIQGASSPNLLPLVLLALAIVAGMRIKRFGYLFWIPLPLGAVFAPYAFYLIARIFKPLAVFADPGIATSVEPFSNLELILGGSLFTALFIALAVFAVLGKRWLTAISLWGFGLVLLAAAWIVQRIEYPQAGSPLSLLFAAALVLLVLVALALESVTKSSLKKVLAASVVIGGVLPLGYQAVSQEVQFKQTDGRVVPWLLVSQSQTDGQVLQLTPTETGYEAVWQPIKGQHLEDNNMAYRFELPERSKTPKYQQLAGLAGNLVSANGVSLDETFAQLRIQYVLVPVGSNAKTLELGSALDSVPELESAGVTEFGRLWRVKSAKPLGLTEHSVWSVTKSIQVAILAMFLLLAIPSRGRSKTGRDSEIFVDGEESDA